MTIDATVLYSGSDKFFKPSSKDVSVGVYYNRADIFDCWQEEARLGRKFFYIIFLNICLNLMLLTELPSDVLILVLQGLTVHELVALARCCKLLQCLVGFLRNRVFSKP